MRIAQYFLRLLREGRTVKIGFTELVFLLSACSFAVRQNYGSWSCGWERTDEKHFGQFADRGKLHPR